MFIFETVMSAVLRSGLGGGSATWQRSAGNAPHRELGRDVFANFVDITRQPGTATTTATSQPANSGASGCKVNDNGNDYDEYQSSGSGDPDGDGDEEDDCVSRGRRGKASRAAVATAWRQVDDGANSVVAVAAL